MLNFNRAVTNWQLYRCGFRDGCDGTLQKNGRVGALQHAAIEDVESDRLTGNVHWP